MTLRQAAASLGVTPDSLRQAIARGALKAEKHGRDWWVTPFEVERYRRESLRRPGPKPGR
jgi:excisionase family DNA binding protein